MSLKLVEVKIERNRNPGGKEGLKEVRKHINILERHQRGEVRRKEKFEELERKYNIKKKGIRTVIEELKQCLHAKAANRKRYEERVNQYKINRAFVQNQKRVYQEMDGIRNINNEKPNVEESKQFGVTYGKMRKNMKEMQNG